MLTKAGVAPDRLPFRRRLLSALTIVATLASSLAALAPTVSAATGPTPTAVSLDLSTAAAGATEVTYTLQFTLPSSGALVANRGVISLAAPKGTFTDQSCSVCLTLTDLTTKASELVPGWRTTTNSDGSELSFTTPIDLGAGDIVRAVLPGLNNAAQPGLHDFSVGTSVSGTTTDRFQAVPASSIKDLSLSRSSALQGATNVTYTVTFQASMSGALPVGSGTVTVAGPVGTFSFPVAGCDNRFTITDVTSGASGTATFCLPVAKTDGGVVVLTTPVAIAAGDEVRVVMPSLHNGTQGADQLMVGTSSDTASSVALGGSTKLPVADVTVSATTAAARATEVTYTVGFTTSGTGALAPGLGTITLHMAPGTFPVPRSRCGSATATITDLATKVKAEGDLCEFATVSTDGAQVQLVTQFQIGAGQAVQVVIGGLHNPDVPGTQTVSVSTSSDTAASASYHITGVGIPITALSVGLSSPAAAADACYLHAGLHHVGTGCVAIRRRGHNRERAGRHFPAQGGVRPGDRHRYRPGHQGLRRKRPLLERSFGGRVTAPAERPGRDRRRPESPARYQRARQPPRPAHLGHFGGDLVQQLEDRAVPDRSGLIAERRSADGPQPFGRAAGSELCGHFHGPIERGAGGGIRRHLPKRFTGDLPGESGTVFLRPGQRHRHGPHDHGHGGAAFPARCWLQAGGRRSPSSPRCRSAPGTRSPWRSRDCPTLRPWGRKACGCPPHRVVASLRSSLGRNPPDRSPVASGTASVTPSRGLSFRPAPPRAGSASTPRPARWAPFRTWCPTAATW